jgi:hypothetical protein
MNTRLKAIIGAAAVLILLVGVTAVLIFTAPDSGDDTEVLTTAPSKSRLLYDLPPANLQALTVKNETGELLIERVNAGDSHIFVVNQFADLPIDFEKVLSDAEAACTMTASEVVAENATDLSIFGLTSPAAEFIAVFDDSKATEKHLLIGNEAPDGYSYYAAFSGEATVYLIDSAALSPFTSDIYDVIDKVIYKEVTPETAEDTTNYRRINDLTITRNDIAYPIEIKYNKDYENPENDSLVSAEYLLVEPVSLNIDPGTSEAVLTSIFGLTASGIEKVRPTAEDLAEYGLAEPFATVVFALTDKTVTLKIGDTYDGGRYCTADDVNIIWKIDEANLPWATVTPLGISSGLIIRRSIYTLSSLDYTGSGISDHFTIAGTNADDMTVTFNGQTVDNNDRFRRLYQYTVMLPPEEIRLDPVTGEPALTLTLTGENFSDIYAFYTLENRRFAVTINGVPQYSIGASYVEKLLSNLEAYKNGGTISIDR